MRRSVAVFAATLIPVLLTSGLVVTSLLSGATTGLTWRQGAHLRGVFDVVGPRGDGRFVVAARGGLFLLDAAGRLVRLDPSYVPTAGESYVAISPGLRDRSGRCSFPRDAIAALDLAPGHPGVTLVSATGVVSHLANVTGVTGLYGITMDVSGRFGHRILVVGREGGGHTKIVAVDCLGRVSTIGSVDVPLEGGIAVAPPTFGAFAGELIAPDELDGILYAVSPNGRLAAVARSGLPFGQDVGVESLGFVPAGGPGGAFLADRLTPGGRHPGHDRVLVLSGAALRGADVTAGDLLAATEGGATVIRVRCAANCSVASVVAAPTAAHGEGSLSVVPRP
ncbi:MAG TPA: hypothetical protein VGZ03_10475 [Acidimicrobiales bacterium]|jgi:hypothetical protein|nr:hypothetical protein [Acidimicrobiales bacterium]